MRTLLLLLLALAASSNLSAQWLPEEAFPEGGYLAAFTLSGNDVIAGGDRIYRSSNRGITWREVMTVQNYMRVTQIEKSGESVFALGDTALWVSRDGGESWLIARSWGYIGRVVLAVSPEGRLAVAAKSWIELSTDYGVTWRRTARTPGLMNAPIAIALVDGRIHVSEIDGHRYSSDQGATWFESPPIDGLRVVPSVFVATRDGTMHAGTSRGYFFSTDNGSTWNRRALSDSVNVAIGTMAIEADTIWTASSYPTSIHHISTDRGATWRVTAQARREGIHRLVRSDDTLWAATRGAGFAWSTDHGATWTDRNNGLREQIGMSLNDYDAFYDYGTFALLTTAVGILRTVDSGRTWTKHDSLRGRGDRRLASDIYDIVRHDDTLYMVDPRGFHLSTDGGLSWEASELSGAGLGHRHRALEVAGDTLVAAGGVFGVVRFVRDAGQWRQIDSTIGVDGTALFVRGDTLFAGGQPSLWRSTDRGVSWQRRTGLAEGLRVRSVHMTPSGIVYAVSDAADLPVLWRSTDGGESWSPIQVDVLGSESSADSVLREGAFAVVGETIFVGLNDPSGPVRGIYSSVDRGETWQAIANGRLTNANVFALGTHGNQLLAATQSYGVWRRALSELVASNPIEAPAAARSLRLRPNPASSLVRADIADVATLTVTDALGRTVLVSTDGAFDAAALSDGLYVVVARGRSGAVSSATLLVQH